MARCAMSRCVVPASCVGAGNYGFACATTLPNARTTNALRASEAQQQRSVLSALSEAVLVFDPEGRVVSMNRAAEAEAQAQGCNFAIGDKASEWVAFREDGSAIRNAELPMMVTLREGIAQRDVLLGVHCSDGSTSWRIRNPSRSSTRKRAGSVPPWRPSSTSANDGKRMNCCASCRWS